MTSHASRHWSCRSYLCKFTIDASFLHSAALSSFLSPFHNWLFSPSFVLPAFWFWTCSQPLVFSQSWDLPSGLRRGNCPLHWSLYGHIWRQSGLSSDHGLKLRCSQVRALASPCYGTHRIYSLYSEIHSWMCSCQRTLLDSCVFCLRIFRSVFRSFVFTPHTPRSIGWPSLAVLWSHRGHSESSLSLLDTHLSTPCSGRTAAGTSSHCRRVRLVSP